MLGSISKLACSPSIALIARHNCIATAEECGSRPGFRVLGSSGSSAPGKGEEGGRGESRARGVVSEGVGDDSTA